MKRKHLFCHACETTFSTQTNLFNAHYHLTKEMKQAILMNLFENQSQKLIAKKSFVSDGTISSILCEAPKDYQTN